jgi:CheY-like chemotaxis protein
MDLEMPLMNGLETTSEIRKLQKEGRIQNDIVIIIFSGNINEDQKSKSILLGADMFLSKPASNE